MDQILIYIMCTHSVDRESLPVAFYNGNIIKVFQKYLVLELNTVNMWMCRFFSANVLKNGYR